MANGEFDESTLHNALLVKHVCENVVEEVPWSFLKLFGAAFNTINL